MAISGVRGIKLIPGYLSASSNHCRNGRDSCSRLYSTSFAISQTLIALTPMMAVLVGSDSFHLRVREVFVLVYPPHPNVGIKDDHLKASQSSSATLPNGSVYRMGSPLSG